VKSKRLVLLLGRVSVVVLLVVVVAVLARNGGDWLREIGNQSWDLDPLPAAASLILLMLSLWLAPIGWTALCLDADCAAGRRELRGVWFTSQLGRYIPGKVWLLAGRTAYLRTAGLPTATSVGIPFFELLYTIAATGLIAAFVTLFTPDFLAEGVLRTAAVLSAVALILLPLLGPLRKLVYRIRSAGSGGSESSGFNVPGFWISLRLLVFFTVIWVARGLALYLWLRSFGVLNRGLWACTAAAPLSWLAGYIVFLVPGGIGVREAAVVAIIAGPGETGPVLAAVVGQRIVLAAMELILAGAYVKSTPLFRKKAE
jgi:uncharacterized membrane protein YbhN (UPF0104 family)